MPKILVTGGAGYIGSHTIIELIKQNYKVIIADNLSNSDIRVLDGIEKITGIKPEFHKIDFADTKATKDFFDKQKNIDTIIHFAAFKAVGESVDFPLKYYKNNIFSLINILENMKKNMVKNIVFSSSCTVYGQAERMPVTEKTPIKKADSPYGNTKQIGEDILMDFGKANPNFNVVALRYFNPIGAHETGIIGELPKGIPNNLIPFVTQTAIGIRKQLQIFGNDYNTPDGTAIRDYIHVCDLATAHVAAIDRLKNKEKFGNFEVFNVGTGTGISVLEIVKEFETVTGQKLNYKIVGRRKGDIEKVWADTKFAEKQLNWKAKRTLSDALSSAWKWEKTIYNEQMTMNK